MKLTFEQLLEEKGYTRYKLAKEAKVGIATISELASGSRKDFKISTGEKIAAILGVDVSVISDCVKGENHESRNNNSQW